ncbi:hypothetical protein JAAARDRAFT_328636 [Jaapia argillacea MUCL 33604]|uniref:Uncharacterized protein n=1 Tax=Jaapia argillacea MUCL 33604 TaxID=933084 RepID=A0A067PWT2_9AGAM|nr:hypothetical protein JAAARDRAFT_328636 [Jaapia argillacea MUCL 33604]
MMYKMTVRRCLLTILPCWIFFFSDFLPPSNSNSEEASQGYFPASYDQGSISRPRPTDMTSEPSEDDPVTAIDPPPGLNNPKMEAEGPGPRTPPGAYKFDSAMMMSNLSAVSLSSSIHSLSSSVLARPTCYPKNAWFHLLYEGRSQISPDSPKIPHSRWPSQEWWRRSGQSLAHLDEHGAHLISLRIIIIYINVYPSLTPSISNP